jgi:isopenicillin-N N-acyltransferase-like protein
MQLTRRAFLAAAALAPRIVLGQDKPAPHGLTVISGKPRERGKRYGTAFKAEIRGFLDREIYRAFSQKAPSRDECLRYAAACGREVKAWSPVIWEELEGAAEGAGVKVEELVLANLHEELWHKGVLPEIEKCTAIAVGPPDTADGHTYVGQTWDWMPSVYGLSQMVHWKREEGGPTLLGYAYPGLWAGAGLNSAGLSLTWTSGDGMGIAGPRVGVPSYLLIAGMLYQATLKDALEEARRAKHAGWFTFVIADGEGRLANVEGTPQELSIEEHRGSLARVSYGSKQIRKDPERQHERVKDVAVQLAALRGKLDRKALGGVFASHAEGGKRVCCHPNTIDVMIFDNTTREAWLSRGPACEPAWKRFSFDG